MGQIIVALCCALPRGRGIRLLKRCRLAARKLDKCIVFAGGDIELLRECVCQFFGGLELVAFQFANGDEGTARASCEFVLGQVKRFAAAAQPQAKRKGLVCGPCWVTCLIHFFISQIVSLIALMRPHYT